ncbi:uncharacterized protein LOC133927655 [Phragmites australis]|uniref:uncharacterized protein LOC133927655 n=1 Tax=Phragmites australis TaxID=29695 RepID=UPI002D765993|nr:uncharacterized protein LOC133927655 [Phragmites australis]
MASSSSSAAPAPPWIILGRITHVQNWGDINLRLTAPPRVSTLTVPTVHHPERGYVDRHPYIVAVDDDAGFLIHVSMSPYIGFDLDRNPPGILYVVLGDFVWPHERFPPISSAMPVPDRDWPEQPGISNIKNVGLVSRRRPGCDDPEYVVAELRFEDHDRASLLSYHSSTAEWFDRRVLCGPSLSEVRRWTWSSHDVIPHNGKLWWVDLVEGILRCNPFAQQPKLWYASLPEAVDGLTARYTRDPPENIESHRMVRASQGAVRFVDIARERINDPAGETLVVIWKLILGPGDLSFWKQQCATSLAEIWASDSYRETKMPEEVPVLALLHPGNPDVVYFFLEQYLFSVNVSESRVVEFVRERCDLIQVVAGPVRPPPISWRYVIAWVLPPSLANSKELDNKDEKHDNQDEKDVRHLLKECVKIPRRPLTYL